MKMSKEGVDALLKKFEGCKLSSYRCPANICTIGYGHTSAAGAPEVKDGMKITQKQADDILFDDLVKYETAVYGMVKQPLNQHQFDVLVDFAYNAGVGALEKSTLLKKVNTAQFDDVPAELMKWTKGGGRVLPGLVKRRQAESSWWVSGEPHSEQEQRTEPDPVPVRTMVESKQGNAAIATAGLASLGAAKEIAAQAQDAADAANQIAGLLHNTNFLAMVAIIGLGAAIWYWRSRNMERDGA